MNSVQNSTSELCIESKLGWVHQVHTLNPGCAHRPRTHCAVSQAWTGRVTADAGPCCALCRVRRVATPPCALLRVSQLPTPYHGSSYVVSRHTPPAARPSHTRRTPLRAGRPCRRASWPCRRLSPRPYRGLIRQYRGRPCVPTAPCVTI